MPRMSNRAARGPTPDDRTATSGEDRYHRLFDAIDESCSVIELIRDPAGRVVDYRFLEVNRAFERLTGLVDAVGNRVRDLVPGLEAAWFERFERVAATGQPERFTQEARELGRWYDSYAFRFDDPSHDCLAVLSTDATERVRVEQALRERERTSRFLLTLADALRPIADPVAIQRTAARVLGDHLGVTRVAYGEVEADGEHIRYERDHVRQRARSIAGRYRMIDFGPSLLAELTAGRTIVERSLATSSVLSREERDAYAALGIHALIGVPLVKDGRFVGNLAIHHATARDWTASEVELAEETAERTWAAVERARDQAERRRLQAEREESLARERHAREAAEAFLAVLSHELKTPVTSIYGEASLLLRGGDSDQIRELASDIQEESERLVRIVDDLLVLSGVERGLLRLTPEPTLLQHVLAAVVAGLRQRHPGAVLEVDAPPGLPPVTADQTAIRQVFHNLLSNAIKYAGDAGPIGVGVGVAGDRLEVTVADRGPGPGEDPEALFRLFYRAPHTARIASGTGIGLYVARELVSAMGGSLGATARPGGGAVFHLALPRFAEAEEPG